MNIKKSFSIGAALSGLLAVLYGDLSAAAIVLIPMVLLVFTVGCAYCVVRDWD